MGTALQGRVCAITGAGRGIELNEIEPQAGGDPVGRLVKLGAGRASRAPGILGEPHGQSPRPRYCRAIVFGRARAANTECLPLKGGEPAPDLIRGRPP